MSEKLFELLIITIAGGIFVAVIGAYLTDGVMPTRRRIGLFLSALAMTIGVCVYFEIPVLSLILEFITNVKCWIIIFSLCLCACIIIAIYKSVQKGSLSPLWGTLKYILQCALIGLVLGMLLSGLPFILMGLEGEMELEEALEWALLSLLFAALCGGVIGILD